MAQNENHALLVKLLYMTMIHTISLVNNLHYNCIITHIFISLSCIAFEKDSLGVVTNQKSIQEGETCSCRVSECVERHPNQKSVQLNFTDSYQNYERDNISPAYPSTYQMQELQSLFRPRSQILTICPLFNWSRGSKPPGKAASSTLDKLIQNLIKRRNVKQTLKDLLIVLQKGDAYQHWKRFDILYPLISEKGSIDNVIELLHFFKQKNIPFYSSNDVINTEAVSFILQAKHKERYTVAEMFMQYATPSKHHLIVWRKALNSQFSSENLSNKAYLSCIEIWVSILLQHLPKQPLYYSYIGRYMKKDNNLQTSSTITVPKIWLKEIFERLHSKPTECLKNCYFAIQTYISSQEIQISIESAIAACQISQASELCQQNIKYAVTLLCQAVCREKETHSQKIISSILQQLLKVCESTTFEDETKLAITFITAYLPADCWKNTILLQRCFQWHRSIIDHMSTSFIPSNIGFDKILLFYLVQIFKNISTEGSIKEIFINQGENSFETFITDLCKTLEYSSLFEKEDDISFELLLILENLIQIKNENLITISKEGILSCLNSLLQTLLICKYDRAQAYEAISHIIWMLLLKSQCISEFPFDSMESLCESQLSRIIEKIQNTPPPQSHAIDNILKSVDIFASQRSIELDKVNKSIIHQLLQLLCKSEDTGINSLIVTILSKIYSQYGKDPFLDERNEENWLDTLTSSVNIEFKERLFSGEQLENLVGLHNYLNQQKEKALVPSTTFETIDDILNNTEHVCQEQNFIECTSSVTQIDFSIFDETSKYLLDFQEEVIEDGTSLIHLLNLCQSTISSYYGVDDSYTIILKGLEEILQKIGRTVVKENFRSNVSKILLSIVSSFYAQAGKIDSSIIEHMANLKILYETEMCADFLQFVCAISDMNIISKTFIVTILSNLSSHDVIVQRLANELASFLVSCLKSNRSLIEGLFIEETAETFLNIITSTTENQLHTLSEYITSYPISFTYTSSTTHSQFFIQVLESCTDINILKILYFMMSIFFSSLHQSLSTRKDKAQCQVIILSWNQPELSQYLRRDLQKHVNSDLYPQIISMIHSLSKCLSYCITRGKAYALFGILPILIGHLPHQENNLEISILQACISMIKLTPDEKTLKCILVSKGVLYRALQQLEVVPKDSPTFSSLYEVVACFSPSKDILETKLNESLSMDTEVRNRYLEYHLSLPIVYTDVLIPRFSLFLSARFYNYLVSDLASLQVEEESLKLLDRLLTLLTDSLRLIDSVPDSEFCDIQIHSKEVRKLPMKHIALPSGISQTHVSTEYKKNLDNIWKSALPVKNHIFSALGQVDCNTFQFYGLDRGFSPRYSRISFLANLIRLLHDDLFFSFEYISKSDINDIISLSHSYIENFIATEGEFDGRILTILDIISILFKRNSVLPFMKTRTFYLKCISRFFRKNTQNILTNLAEDSKKTSTNIYTILFKRAPMLFDLKLKEAVFRIRINKLRSEEKDVFVVRRNNILESATFEFENRKKTDFKKHWKLKFEGEDTIDIRGVTREFVSLFSSALTSQNYPIWRMTDSLRALPNADTNSISKLDQLKYMNISGKFFAKSFLEKELVDIRLCSFVLKKLLNKRLSYYDMESVDRQLYENQILWIRDNDISKALDGLSFTVTLEDGSETELIPGGKEKFVTNDNKLEFLDLLVEYKLTKELEEHFQSLIKGFSDVIPLKEIYMFNEEEFELLLCGKENIDIADLKQHAVLKFGFDSNSPTILHLWDILESLNSEDKRKFIQFVTGSPRVPVEGFRSLQPLFTIQRIEEKDKLPSASTCFNLLKLPDFQNKRILRNKLKMILRDGVEGFGYS